MNYCNKKGFTLLELLIYVAIIAIGLSLISAFLMMLLVSRVKNETISEVEFQGFQVVEVISYNIRNAEEVSFPVKGEESSILVLDDYFTFSFQDGVVYIQEGGGDLVNLTNSSVTVSDFVFRNVGLENAPDSINFSFTISRINHSGRSEYSYEKEFTASTSLRK